MPAKFSALTKGGALKAALLGEHNEYVLSELLGMKKDEINDLYAAGILGKDPLA